MYTTVNHPFPKKEIEKLASQRQMHSVSIYLPMQRKGKEQNEHIAQGHLKSCIKEVSQSLSDYQLHKDEIDRYIQPLEALLAQVELWRNPSDGLAIFLNKDGLNYYSFPISFDTRSYVSDHFYLQPLLPLYYNDGLYYLLELSEDYVKFYECSRYGFKDLFIEDVAPTHLEKSAGSDYKPKVLQVRSGHMAYGAGSFHGHGEGKDDRKEEMAAYFRAIDTGVKKLIKDEKAPLMLACTDELFGLYKAVNTHPVLFEKHLGGDPEFTNKTEIHEDSWNLIQDYFEKTKKYKIALFSELYHTPKTSYDLSDIIPAAMNGKIETLFVKKGAEIYGHYNPENNQVRFDETKELSNVSLLNFASMHTFLQKGNVYELDPKEMPVKERPLNAIFRF